jgi:N-acetylmuramate 1-kinase
MTALTRDLADAAATEALGAELSLFARVGMLIRLEGDLGAGKTTLARGFIRALAGDPELDVPSPTFTLVQTYAQGRLPVAHADLYRLAQAAEVEELAFEELIAGHVLLVEWPEKLGAELTPSVLTVRLLGSGAGRRAEISGQSGAAQALQRFAAIERFLAERGWQSAERRFLEGDASFRRYERMRRSDERVILMDMPARPDGPPVKHGLPYSAIAHLAENIAAVIGISDHLHAEGYSTPRTLAADFTQGLAVIEDLGDGVYGRMMLKGEDMREPMAEAVGVLADMAGREWPHSVSPAPGLSHRIMPYDRGALAIETELLTDWYWPYTRGSAIGAGPREEFAAAWAALFPLAEPRRPVWTLRDYHSPNLLWLPERRGLKRAGLIDTQDCVLGHPAYDLVSMLQDARVTVAPHTADELLDMYCGLRRGAPDFKETDFRAAFAVLGAQRMTKVLGIFARLFKRDGKSAYLKHMPRVSAYLARDLMHPALAPLARWYRTHLPEIFAP